MINLNERLSLRDGNNLLYYQDFSRHPIADYRKTVEETAPTQPQRQDVYLHESVIDFSNDANVSNQSLLLKPAYYSTASESVIDGVGSLKTTLLGSGGKGLFYGTSQNNRMTIRYKFLQGTVGSTTLKIVVTRQGASSATSTRNISFSSSDLNTWRTLTYNITSSLSSYYRYYVSIEIIGGFVLLDGMQLNIGASGSTPPAYSVNKIDRTLYEYLLEGGDRTLKLTLYDHWDFTYDIENIDEGSLKLTHSLWENSIYGGCISSQLTASVEFPSNITGAFVEGAGICLRMYILQKEYYLFTGILTKIEKALEHNWYDIVAQDAIGADFSYVNDAINADLSRWYFELFESTGVPKEMYRGVWSGYKVYPVNAVVYYAGEYYKYDLSRVTSRSNGVTFNGEVYHSSLSLRKAFKGTSPSNIRYTYQGTTYSLPIQNNYVPYTEKTIKSEYKGTWNQNTTYSYGDIVWWYKYDSHGNSTQTYYQYGPAMGWLVNGVTYATLIVGVQPQDIPENFREVSQDLISDIGSGYDIYDYPAAKPREFATALLDQHDIKISDSIDGGDVWSITSYDGQSAIVTSAFKIIYEKVSSSLNGLSLLRDCCQLIGKFGYMDEYGEFNLMDASGIHRNTFVIDDLNYISSSSKSKDETKELKQLVLGRDSDNQYYPRNQVFTSGVLDLSNNRFIKSALQNESKAGQTANIISKSLFEALNVLDYTPNSIEEIVGVFIGIGTSVTVNLSNGETLSFVVSKVEYSGPQLINQKIECAEMF